MSDHSGGYIERVEVSRDVNPATNRPTFKSAWVGVCSCGERIGPLKSSVKCRTALAAHAAEIVALDAALEVVPLALGGGS